MKSIVSLAVLVCFSLTCFAQFEVAKSDTAAATQPTRIRYEANSAGQPGFKGSTGPFVRLALWSEVMAASSGVQKVNNVSPSSGNVTLTTNDVSENVNLYYTNTRARAAFSASGAITYNSTTGAFGFTQPAITGDASIASGGTTLTLASVNSNVGSFGAANTVPVLTVNAKGLVTGVGTAAITPAGIGAPDLSMILPVTTVTTYAGISGVTAPAAGSVKIVEVTTDGTYSETSALYVLKSNGKYHKIITGPAEN